MSASEELLKALRSPDMGWSGDAMCVSAEVAEQAADEIERLRSALQSIADQHVPDQPAAYADMSERDWAWRHVARLRAIAMKALASPPSQDTEAGK